LAQKAKPGVCLQTVMQSLLQLNRSSPIMLSGQVGGMPAPEPVDVIDGEARLLDEARMLLT
jgi:hypothetical protein